MSKVHAGEGEQTTISGQHSIINLGLQVATDQHEASCAVRILRVYLAASRSVIFEALRWHLQPISELPPLSISQSR